MIMHEHPFVLLNELILLSMQYNVASTSSSTLGLVHGTVAI